MSDLNHYLMRQIVLDAEFNAYTVFAGDEVTAPKRLEGLGKINIFVGANNSGKSRLIRSLAKTKKIVFEPREEALPLGLPIREINKLGRKLTERLKSEHYSVHEMVNMLGVQGIIGELENQKFEGSFTEFKGDNSRLTNVIDILSRMEVASSPRAEQQGWNSFGIGLVNAKEAVRLAINYERASHGKRCSPSGLKSVITACLEGKSKI